MNAFLNFLKSDFGKPAECIIGLFAALLTATILIGPLTGISIDGFVKLPFMLVYFLLAPILVSLSFSGGSLIASLGLIAILFAAYSAIKYLSGKRLRLSIIAITITLFLFGGLLSANYVVI
ncbi:hypothetical protein [Cognatishimia maritima]|uniref:Uncharacterized protein n=1 Tax=Cognatishimia maritima TaxID=870908 RepID=A0A1M5J011_9RHOB|nr:hypothetical protein [Cognatishimia maritima]SHG33896.1 hypothetical protein SAMN04488044_0502 [Cognatishimia maritima]